MSEEDKKSQMFMQSGNTFIPDKPLLFSEREALQAKIESLEGECATHADMVLTNFEQIKELQGICNKLQSQLSEAPYKRMESDYAEEITENMQLKLKIEELEANNRNLKDSYDVSMQEIEQMQKEMDVFFQQRREKVTTARREGFEAAREDAEALFYSASGITQIEYKYKNFEDYLIAQADNKDAEGEK
jgi:hypothetical protein